MGHAGPTRSRRGDARVAPTAAVCLMLAAWNPVGAATDMAGRSVAVPASAHRVVSLLPSITETAFALGRGDRLVGRTRWCKQPPEAEKLPVVGDIANPATEAVLVLQPDLVLVGDFDVNRGPLEALEALKLPVYFLDFKDYEPSLQSIERMGEFLDAREQAAAMIASIRGAEADVRRRTAGLPRPKVLITIGHGPVWVAGKDTFLDRLIDAAGGVNVESGRSGYGALETEAILLAAPDVVLVAEVESQMPSALEYWGSPELAELPARKSGRVLPLPERDTVPGPYMRQAFLDVLRAIHPEAGP
jgi:cobalamin transport system substrate-binding protein